jgi:hypothetical protein
MLVQTTVLLSCRTTKTVCACVRKYCCSLSSNELRRKVTTLYAKMRLNHMGTLAFAATNLANAGITGGYSSADEYSRQYR